MGKTFLIQTDKKSLKFLLEQRDISLDYQEWLTKLLGYDFEISYKAGIDNKVADGLSRVIIDRHLNAERVLCALIMPSSVQMQSIFDENDANEDIQQMIKEVFWIQCLRWGILWQLEDYSTRVA